MSRNVAWKRNLSNAASWRQDQGLSATIFIVREVGPTGFLLKEDGDEKPFKVCKKLTIFVGTCMDGYYILIMI